MSTTIVPPNNASPDFPFPNWTPGKWRIPSNYQLVPTVDAVNGKALTTPPIPPTVATNDLITAVHENQVTTCLSNLWANDQWLLSQMNAAGIGAVPTSRRVNAGTGLGGGGALTADVTLTANVVSVFNRTGAVVLTGPDVSGAGGVLTTRQILAGAGMSGGGDLSADVTLNALVTSVFGRTGAVVLTASDISTAGGVPATRQVLAGTGLLGGGQLVGDVTLSAAVVSVFGRTGAIVPNTNDYTAAQVKNAVDASQQYANPTWLTAIPWSIVSGAPPMMTDPTTSQGDLIVRSTSALVALSTGGVANDGLVLTTDSTRPEGIKWATPGAATLTPWTSNINAAGYQLQNAGRIGIGTISPTYQLCIHSPSVATSQVHISYDGSDQGGYLSSGSGFGMHVSAGMAMVNGSWVAKAAGASWMNCGQNGNISFYGFTGQTVGNAITTGTPIATITPSAVGIATSNPVDPLHIYTSNFGIRIQYATDNSYLRIGAARISAFTSSDAETSLLLNPGGGKIGIGTFSPDTAVTIDGSAPICEIRSGGYLQLRPTANSWDMRLQASSTPSNRLDVLSGGNLTTPIASFLDGGNVGIGTTTAIAGAKLSVTGDIYANGVMRIDGTNSLYFQAYGGGWTMSDTTWMRSVNAKSIWLAGGLLGSDGGLTVGYGGQPPAANGASIAGNTGIGVLAPNAKLHVAGTTRLNGQTYAQAGTNPTSWQTSTLIVQEQSANTAYGMHLSYGASYPVSGAQVSAIQSIQANATSYLQLNPLGGAVTICNMQGTAGPGYPLTVATAAGSGLGIGWNASNGTGETDFYNYGGGGGGGFYWYNYGSNGSAWPTSGASLCATLYPTALILQQANAQFGVSTTPAAGISISAMRTDGIPVIQADASNVNNGYPIFRVKTDTRTYELASACSGSGAAANLFYLFDRTRSATICAWNTSGQMYLGGMTSASYLLQLASDSAAKPGTSSWTVASDVRQKRNIEPVADDSLSIVDALRFIRFEYNGVAASPDDGTRCLGLSAQELREVLPEAVGSTRAKLHPDDAEETDVLDISYHYVFVHCARAIQQLLARVRELEGKN